MKHPILLNISKSIFTSIILTCQFYFYPTVKAQTIIPETCKKLSQLDARVYYDFCEAALGTALGSNNATNITQLGSISFNLDISESELILTEIETLLEDTTLDSFTIDALKECLDIYSGVHDDLVMGFKYFEDGNYFMANLSANDALNMVIKCENGLKKGKFLVTSTLSRDNSDFVQLVAISICFTMLLGGDGMLVN